jgi:hypothetical protein
MVNDFADGKWLFNNGKVQWCSITNGERWDCNSTYFSIKDWCKLYADSMYISAEDAFMLRLQHG